MDLNKLILDTLNPINLDVAYQHYAGSESNYIRFFYMPKALFETDDSEQFITHYVQVDIFTLGNPNDYAQQVKTLLKDAGFKKNFEHETYEEDTHLFHYILRFYFIEEE